MVSRWCIEYVLLRKRLWKLYRMVCLIDPRTWNMVYHLNFKWHDYGYGLLVIWIIYCMYIK